MKPHSYQRRALEQLDANGNTGLLAMQLGTGKTATACWAIEQAGVSKGKVLIVAPLRTRSGWERHVKDILGRDLYVIDGKKRGKENRARVEAGNAGVYFIGWEYMRTAYSHKVQDVTHSGKRVNRMKAVSNPFNGVHFDALIADEWHRASSHKSLNFQVIRRIKATHRLALSATPAGNAPSRIWSALEFLWPGEWGGYWKFAERFFNKRANAFSALGYEFTTERCPGMVRENTPCYVEITQREANPELPEVIIERVEVPLTREQRKIYDAWEQEALAWLDAYPVAIEIPATLDLRLRQATLGQPYVSTLSNGDITVDFDEDCKSSKLDALIDIMADLPEGEPVVVWCHSQRFIKAVLYRLRKAGYSAAEISGKSKADYRDMINGKVQVLVAQHEAMSEGVDGLQRVCGVEVWLSQSNSLVINEQATGRLHRQGQDRPVVRYLIQASNTIDSRVLGRLESKYSALKESGLI